MRQQPLFWALLRLAPHAHAFFQAATREPSRVLVSVFERYDHATAMRIAKELDVLREYVRGEPQVVRDIALSFELYEAMFPAPESTS